MYIYQNSDWPNFTWNNDVLLPIISKVRNLQGKIIGKMESLGFDLSNEANLETLTLEVIKSTEIEGEFLNPEQVRSSIARRLGIEISVLIPSDRNVEGIVDLMFDATRNFDQNLSFDRLFSWHSALFPSGRSSLYKITVGDWRTDSTGPMQVVSGPLGKEKVHYQAIDSDLIEKEMNLFVNWCNKNDEIEPLIKAGIAHLWFVTIHPFEDGNGRITRALTEMLLAQSDGSSQRFYSMSAQIRKERKNYYEILEKTQRESLNVTNWLVWFLNCLSNAIISAELTLSKVLNKANFWKLHATTIVNQRQQTMINKLLDGFDGKLTTSKWARINKCSQDTALRDIQDLINKDILQKEHSGGRSTNYEIKNASS